MQQIVSVEAREKLEIQQFVVAAADQFRREAPQIAYGRADVTRASSPTPYPRPPRSHHHRVAIEGFREIMKWAVLAAPYSPVGARHAGVLVGVIGPREPCAPGFVEHARMGPCNLADQVRSD